MPEEPEKKSPLLQTLQTIYLIVGILAGVAVLVGFIAHNQQSTSQSSLIQATTTNLPSPTKTPTPKPTPKATEKPRPTTVPVSAPPPTSTPRGTSAENFTVSAVLYWQDTGITIEAGDQVSIIYLSGLWTYSPYISPYDAAGPLEQYICADHYPVSQCSLPDPYYVQGALVGEVGTQILAVGDQLNFVANQSGDLMLAINDGYNGDNSGSVTVQITDTP